MSPGVTLFLDSKCISDSELRCPDSILDKDEVVSLEIPSVLEAKRTMQCVHAWILETWGSLKYCLGTSAVAFYLNVYYSLLFLNEKCSLVSVLS